MNKVIELRILLEELSDIARQGHIHQFVEVMKSNCSVMLFDKDNLCYKLFFKEQYWLNTLEEMPQLEKYYFGAEYDQ